MTEHEVECTAELQNSCYMLTLTTEFGVMKEKLKTTVEKTANHRGKNCKPRWEKLGAMATKLKVIESQLDELRNKKKTNVLFSTVLRETGKLGPFSKDTNLTYSKVITNIGNA